MNTAKGEVAGPPVSSDQVHAVMVAAQALVGVAAQGVAEVEDRVTLPQLRVLMLVATRGGLNLGALAQAMGVHPSNASRACDRLVEAGFLQRTESTLDRRNLMLELTDKGDELIDELIGSRRATIASILAQMPESRRRTLASAMLSFAQASDATHGESAWKLGWPRTRSDRSTGRG
ncbi:MAG: MarR family transcriptional regulator [Humibacillus sp.]|nr:MarR family transcriptional regulator [Humibacillus sp.]MDN5775696.1 MarR family transcriptional regulator [Humibacillus sp.]